MTSKLETLADLPGLINGEDGLRRLVDNMPQIVWSTLPDGFHDYYNARWYEFTGVPDGSTDGEGWTGMFHPDDQARARTAWSHSLETGEPYQIDYRLRHRSGDYRWTIGRANPIRSADGTIIRWIGTCTDVDEARRHADQNDIMSRELSHRIKNIFAVIGGLISLSSRQRPETKAFSDELRDRLAALGRAHEFASPHSDGLRPALEASKLHGLLREILRPYPALSDGRIMIAGDDVAIDDRGATPLALAFHESATNAAKYGALSTPEGRIEIRSRLAGEDLLIEWIERGGPRLSGPPAAIGFGTRLMEMSVVKQLDGRIERSWNPDGLSFTLTLQPSRLVRN